MAGYNSTGAFSAGLCKQILLGLENITKQENLPELKRSYLGFTDALRSSLNTAGVQMNPIPIQDGTKKKTVTIAYLQRAVESEVTSSEDGNCTPERYPDYTETNFDVSLVASTNFGLSRREATLLCMGGGNQQLLNSFMMRAFDAINRKINRDLLGIALLNFGFNYGNSPASAATKSVNVLVAATGAPLATGVQDVDQDYTEKNEYYGVPLVVGAGNIKKYYKTIGTGCCNQDGVDMQAYLNASGGIAFFQDNMIESVIGTNQFLVMAPGMCQFVPWYRYVGDNAGSFGTSFDMIVTDPRTGMRYDVKIDQDGCNEKVYVRITLNYDLWIQPTDTYNAADPLYRTNGLTRYTAATT